ncbi:MAG: hypothetical protein M3Z01_01340, partial [Thermoproteota archaeon]|nr:hypothetical protein [Thermoproteota archaeon]
MQIVLLVGTILLSLFTFQTMQNSYAQTVKTFNIKAQIDKKVITLGDTQTVKVTVLDGISKQPVSGAQVKAVIN